MESPSTCLNLFPYKEICTPIGGRGGGKRAIFGYVWKNAPVQEDSYLSIYLFRLTPKVYISNFLPFIIFIYDLEKKLLINEVD